MFETCLHLEKLVTESYDQNLSQIISRRLQGSIDGIV